MFWAILSRSRLYCLIQLHLLLQDLGGVRLLQTNVHPKSQKRVRESSGTPWVGIPFGEGESLCELAS